MSAASGCWIGRGKDETPSIELLVNDDKPYTCVWPIEILACTWISLGNSIHLEATMDVDFVMRLFPSIQSLVPLESSTQGSFRGLWGY
jgi:hypothetical protein